MLMSPKMYIHLVLDTDDYISRYNKKAETAHCISLVFQDSHATSVRAKQMAYQLLPDWPTPESRKKAYQKLARVLGDCESAKIDALQTSEKVEDLFCHTKISL